MVQQRRLRRGLHQGPRHPGAALRRLRRCHGRLRRGSTSSSPSAPGPRSARCATEAGLDRYRDARRARCASGWSSAIGVLLGADRRRVGVGPVAHVPAVAPPAVVRHRRPVLRARTSASSSSTLPWFHYVVNFALMTIVLGARRRRRSCTTSSAASGCSRAATRSPAPPRCSSRCCSGCSCWSRRVDYWLDRFDLTTDQGRPLHRHQLHRRSTPCSRRRTS